MLQRATDAAIAPVPAPDTLAVPAGLTDTLRAAITGTAAPWDTALWRLVMQAQRLADVVRPWATMHGTQPPDARPEPIRQQRLTAPHHGPMMRRRDHRVSAAPPAHVDPARAAPLMPSLLAHSMCVLRALLCQVPWEPEAMTGECASLRRARGRVQPWCGGQESPKTSVRWPAPGRT